MSTWALRASFEPNFNINFNVIVSAVGEKLLKHFIRKCFRGQDHECLNFSKPVLAKRLRPKRKLYTKYCCNPFSGFSE